MMGVTRGVTPTLQTRMNTGFDRNLTCKRSLVRAQYAP